VKTKDGASRYSVYCCTGKTVKILTHLRSCSAQMPALSAAMPALSPAQLKTFSELRGLSAEGILAANAEWLTGIFVVAWEVWRPWAGKSRVCKSYGYGYSYASRLTSNSNLGLAVVDTCPDPQSL
jgi:hypothetical protein